MNLNLEKLIQHLEMMDREIARLTANRESFKQLLQDAVREVRQNG